MQIRIRWEAPNEKTRTKRPCKGGGRMGQNGAPNCGLAPGLGDAGARGGARGGLSRAQEDRHRSRRTDARRMMTGLLRAKLPTSGHFWLLWFKLILSISPVQD